MDAKNTLIGLCTTLTITMAQSAESWQLGFVAENSRSPFVDGGRKSNALPIINYVGERLRFTGGNLQYDLSSNDGNGVYIVGQFRARQLYYASLEASDEAAWAGMTPRHSAFELGVGYQARAALGQWVVEGVRDASGAHNGYQLTAKFSRPQQIGRWMVQPAIGVQHQSRRLVDYYHGVTAAEVRADRPAYRGGSATNAFTSLMIGYVIDPQWLLLANVERVHLGESIAASPIVETADFFKGYVALMRSF